MVIFWAITSLAMPKKSNISVTKDRNTGKWVVDISAGMSPTGKRRRVFFKTKKEADEEMKTAQSSSGQAIALLKSSEASLIAQAMRYAADLEFRGSSLKLAYTREVERIEMESRSKTLGAALDAFEEERGSGWSDRFKSARWNTFCNHLEPMAEESLASLGAEFWREWLTAWKKSGGRASTTYNDMLAMLKMLFQSRVCREVFAVSPLSDIRRHKVPKKAAVVLSPDEVRALLATAWRDDRELVPWFAVTIFSGLRPDSEVWSLKWEHISFAEDWLKVVAGNKTDTQRYVSLEDNLKSWLAPFRQKRGLVCEKSGFAKRRRKIYKSAGVEWAHDITRHSYCSYFVAHYQDPQKMQINAGHQDGKMFERHYKNARTKKQAAEFWGIVPPDEAEKMVAFG